MAGSEVTLEGGVAHGVVDEGGVGGGASVFTDMRDLQKGMLIEANDKFGKWYIHAHTTNYLYEGGRGEGILSKGQIPPMGVATTTFLFSKGFLPTFWNLTKSLERSKFTSEVGALVLTNG